MQFHRSAFLYICILFPAFFLFPLETEQVQKRKADFVLLPFINLENGPGNDYLEMQIFHVFRLNLEACGGLVIISPGEGMPDVPEPGQIGVISRYLPAYTDAHSLICGEYYQKDNTLHIFVTVVDIGSGRVRECFSRSLPADKKLLQTIEEMAIALADTLAGWNESTQSDLPGQTQRENRLRNELAKKESFIREIFGKQNSLLVSPGSGLSMGRTAVSWTPEGPLLSPSFGIEYGRILFPHFHLKAGIEILPLDLFSDDKTHSECTFEILAGYHSEDIVSFYISGGLAVIYDYNEECAALASGTAASPIYPAAERISLSIPVQTGCIMSIGPRWFADIRMRYNGLTWTIEKEGPASYPEGEKTFLYWYGFSVMSLLDMSIAVQIGYRF
ncbi:MAG: hypothetical protein JW874_11940 [Spirochaetales bacterium]|nr:hypothetical protein [Spirochaetales bacterium]